MEAATEAIGFAVTKARQSLGASGEQAADEHLAQQGLIVLERNFRCRLGEIDIIARDGEQLVFCEVKTRVRAGRIRSCPSRSANSASCASWGCTTSAGIIWNTCNRALT